jgi:hypothetical protein
MQPTSSSSEKPRGQAPESGAAPEPADARDRIARRIQFPDGATWATDTPMAARFRDALCDALLSEDIERIRVRCGVARDEDDALRFMCKVEYAGDGSAEGAAAYPWSWWSPLAEKPEELVAELRRALRARRERLNGGRRGAPGAPPAGADKARGASHDTWTTAPWDLGARVRPDSFCGNRRGRWGSQAAGPRPLRPRSPRH